MRLAGARARALGVAALSSMGLKPVGARARTAEETNRMAAQRLGVVVIAFALFLGVVVVRLVQLQGIAPGEYEHLGAQQWLDEIELRPGRGSLTDRNGRALAVSVDRATVSVNPRQIEDPLALATQLATVVPGVDAAQLAQRIEASDKYYLVVAKQVAPEIADALADMEITGVYLANEPVRMYPSGNLGAQVLGFVDAENVGQAGVERLFDEELTGEPGELVAETDPRGRLLPNGVKEWRNAQPGVDVQLTLDADIQFEAERALGEAVAEHNAKGGFVLMMDSRNGDVLAYATSPGFDPNDPGDTGSTAWNAWGVGSVFEPGSTSKAITVASALEEGVVTPDTEFAVDDAIRVHAATIHDSSPHATRDWTVREILARSSNVGTVRIVSELGGTALYEYMKKFGYGRRTGVELPSESPGILRAPEDWMGIDVATASIGHAVAVTPLQVLRVYSVFANDGVMVEPRLVLSKTTAEGEELEVERPGPERVVSPETAAAIREMLGLVVSYGTGPKAAVPNYVVGGKTGTARKLEPDAEGVKRYVSRYHASFVGIAPLDDPRIVTMVMLDEPSPIYYGGSTAAPVFSQVVQFALGKLRVPPSDQEQVIDEWPEPKRSGGAPRSTGVLRLEPPRGEAPGDPGQPSGDSG